MIPAPTAVSASNSVQERFAIEELQAALTRVAARKPLGKCVLVIS